MKATRWVMMVVATTTLLLAACGAGERDATPDERHFQIAVGEVVNIPVAGTNHSARTGPQVFEETGDAISHDFVLGDCPGEMEGCAVPTKLKVTGARAGTSVIKVRTCFFENGPKDCQKAGDPVSYTVVVR